MEIIVESVDFKNPSLNETDGTDWLLDNIGDVVNVEVKFRMESYLLATSETPNDGDIVIVTRPAEVLTGRKVSSFYLWTDDPVGFEDFEVGDKITTTGSIASNDAEKTIVAKVDAQLLQMDTPYSSSEFLPVGATAHVSTKIESVEYLHALIENDDPVTYESLTDGTEQRASVQGLSNTDTSTIHNLVQLGNKSYQYGGLTIVGNNFGSEATTVFSQGFTLNQTFLINPLFLADQIEDLEDDVPPSYFLNANSLKYVFRIEASKDLTDPNRKKIVVEDERLGNTGWFDENFNTRLTNYTFQNLVYKRLDGTINPSLELTENDTIIQFQIKNTVDNPFTVGAVGNMKFVLNHWLLPIPESEYRQPEFSTGPSTSKNNNLKTNFIFDRIVSTLETQTVGSDNAGTDIEVFKDVVVLRQSNSVVNVTATVDLATQAAARIAGLSDKKYALSISLKHFQLERAKSDKVTLKIDVDKYFIDSTDPTMILIDPIEFVEHPYTESGSVTAPTVRVEDDVVGLAKFKIDQNGREADIIILTSSVTEIIMSNGIDEFPLESNSVPLSASKRVNGIPYVNFTQDRGFKTPADALRRDITLQRKTLLDAGGLFHYQHNYPFGVAWEFWEPLSGVDDVFFDTAEDNNGENQEWVRYPKTAGWEMYFRITINATKNGTPQVYTRQALMDTQDYLESIKWDFENTKTFDNATNDELFDGVNYLLQKLLNSRLEANKTYVSASPPPVVGDLVIRVGINVHLEGNRFEQYTLSSAYDRHPASWLLSIDTSNRVVITNPSGAIFRGACLADGSQLPAGSTFKFFARVYDKRAETPVPFGTAKLQEDGFFKLQEDGNGFKMLE